MPGSVNNKHRRIKSDDLLHGHMSCTQFYEVNKTKQVSKPAGLTGAGLWRKLVACHGPERARRPHTDRSWRHHPSLMSASLPGPERSQQTARLPATLSTPPTRSQRARRQSEPTSETCRPLSAAGCFQPPGSATTAAR